MAFERQAEDGAGSISDPVPVLALGYETVDPDRIAGRRGFRKGLLLVAIGLLSAMLIYVIIAVPVFPVARRRSLALLNYALDLPCAGSIFVGGWILLGFDGAAVRRMTPVARVSRGLLLLSFGMHAFIMLLQVRPPGYWLAARSYSSNSLLATQIVQAAWFAASIWPIVRAARGLDHFSAGGYRIPVLAAAIARGVLAVAGSVYGYFVFRSINRLGIAGPPFVWWRALALISLVASATLGIVLLLLVRKLGRSEIADT